MPDEPTKITVIAGKVLRDPESKPITVHGEDMEVVNFSVAVTVTYGDRNDSQDYGESRYYSVGVWREDLRDWVMENIHKGSNVSVEGTLTKTDKDGSTYRNISAFRVGLIDWYVRGKASGATTRPAKKRTVAEDDDEDL